MKQLHKVHMVPTDKPTHSGIWLNQVHKNLAIYEAITKAQRPAIPQHLYFTSDEEIKVNDWFLHYNNKTPFIDKCTSTGQSARLIWNSLDPKAAQVAKIVATTNKELWHTYADKLIKDYYPDKMIAHISQDFIEEYVRRKGAIEEVMLETEGSGVRDKYVRVSVDQEVAVESEVLKLNPAGEVIWSLREERMYNHEEVMKMALETGKWVNEQRERENRTIYPSDILKWFDKNYS